MSSLKIKSLSLDMPPTIPTAYCVTHARSSSVKASDCKAPSEMYFSKTLCCFSFSYELIQNYPSKEQNKSLFRPMEISCLFTLHTCTRVALTSVSDVRYAVLLCALRAAKAQPQQPRHRVVMPSLAGAATAGNGALLQRLIQRQPLLATEGLG